jgi:hypothetical protein
MDPYETQLLTQQLLTRLSRLNFNKIWQVGQALRNAVSSASSLHAHFMLQEYCLHTTQQRGHYSLTDL